MSLMFDLFRDITVMFMVPLLARLDKILPCQYWCIGRGNHWPSVMQLAALRGFTATTQRWAENIESTILERRNQFSSPSLLSSLS